MDKIKLAVLAAGLSLASASPFATNCSDFIAGPNKVVAKYIAENASKPRDLFFNKKGDFTANKEEAARVNIDFVIKSFALSPEVVKQISARFTRAETLGVRTANRRLACKFIFDFNDGFRKTITDYRMIDVESTSDYNNIAAYYGPGEPQLSGSFDPREVAQTVIGFAVFNAVKASPEYKAQMAKFQ